jgi:hypothetical protein
MPLELALRCANVQSFPTKQVLNEAIALKENELHNLVFEFSFGHLRWHEIPSQVC